jgi:cytochrome c-type biogenesis protein CcmF
MIEVGHFSLCCSWIITVYGLLVLLFSRGKTDLVKSGLLALPFSALALISSLVSLSICFLRDEYALQYVWQYSNREMSDLYKVTAVWGGMDGSMLLWSVILSCCGGLLWLDLRKADLKNSRWTAFVFFTTLFFFETVTIFFTNPFRYLNAPFVPLDGQGLNPLLQNPYMAIHPPMLYLGFTTFALPYCFCMGALLAGDSTSDWIGISRKWTLVAWMFLTTGIVLGGHWAYLELGWGGFWAWDPVENSSFLPWLTGTAFLHSVIVQVRKGMLKVWNVILVTLTYSLTVFGTFLTRSGVVQSVHAFAETDIGWVFLVYLGMIVVSSALVIWVRRDVLRPERFIQGFLSREVAFLTNNLILVGICFAVFWGVMFPVFSEALTGEKQTVGIPFFNKVTIPLFLLLIFTMGIGPLVPWRKADVKRVFRLLRGPTLAGVSVSSIFLFGGVTSYYATLSYGLCAFLIFSIGGEFHQGVRSQNSAEGSFFTKLRYLFVRHPSRYGGLVVHFGVAIATIGITASMAHKIEKEVSLNRGESSQVGRYQFKLDAISDYRNADTEGVVADVAVSDRSGIELYKLKPELRYYITKQETTTEVALRMGVREDVYVVLAGTDDTGQRASLKIFINPLQVWLWFGAIIMVLGTLLALIPVHRKVVIGDDS